MFEAFQQQGLLAYDGLERIDWEWLTLDGSMGKAPLGGEKTGPNPTDRAKCGTKRSLLTHARGTPLYVVVAGANRNDHKLMAETLEAVPVKRPQPTPDEPQHLCLDKGYDYQEPRDLVEAFGFTLHLRTRGEEIAGKREAGKTARRCVVERPHSWLNCFRRILIRWDKSQETTSPCSTSPEPSLHGEPPYRDSLLAPCGNAQDTTLVGDPAHPAGRSRVDRERIAGPETPIALQADG